MMNRICVIVFFSLLPILGFSQPKESVRLFFLGGQSNMNGFGFIEELPDSLTTGYEGIFIFQGNPVPDETENGGLGLWSILKPGHGAGFSSDGNTNFYTNRFGIELSFAKTLQALYPNEKIALIKYSRSGSSIDSAAAGQFGSWEPDYMGGSGINQYDHFLTTMKLALSNTDIDGDGIEEHLIPSGILWMQGESDASYSEDIANAYYINLSRLMNLIAASMHADDLPIVIGKISDSLLNNWESDTKKVWPYGELVQYAQEKYAREHTNVAIVRNTRHYNYSDPWHYDSAGYIDLGKRFALAFTTLFEW